ncbi:hypothetical protein IWQ62_002803 [Dispira parvispora]|uniref:C2H2-type domain-containing protein n=1 Tax=Dispira parvispora TaxID=1520584 RepID=A0A9W8AV25_9FUNG|nr:hypothetical protein IWQ62_002803 [Dispira parvispora]
MADSEWQVVGGRQRRKSKQAQLSVPDKDGVASSTTAQRKPSHLPRGESNYTKARNFTAPSRTKPGNPSDQAAAGRDETVKTRPFPGQWSRGRGRGRGGYRGVPQEHSSDRRPARGFNPLPRPLYGMTGKSTRGGMVAEESRFKFRANPGEGPFPGKDGKRNEDDTDSDKDDEDDDDGDEEDATEAVFPPVSFLVLCPFANCPDDTLPLTQPAPLTNHLSEAHGLVFKNLHHMSFSLQKYLDSWAAKLAQDVSVIEGLVTVPATESNGRPEYTIDASQCPVDQTLRQEIQKAKLDEILKTQARERQEDAKQSRKCLFCKQICDHRQHLFRHMFTEHNFNIGLPDNLVDVNEFLNILEGKLGNLQCLYCEKTFTSAAVLRKHMRKKKHFKISARNRLYDRFYVVNFLEPGKNWENFENEVYDSDEDRRDDSWDDWQEELPTSTMCLFDDVVAPTPEEACQHMQAAHGFDIHAIRQTRGLDFYKTVALINFIRRQTAGGVCMGCGTKVDESVSLVEHMEKNGCFTKIPEEQHTVWTDPHFLFPTYENDPLLMWFDDSWSGDEAESDPAQTSEPHGTQPPTTDSTTQDKSVSELADSLATVQAK